MRNARPTLMEAKSAYDVHARPVGRKIVDRQNSGPRRDPFADVEVLANHDTPVTGERIVVSAN